MVHLFLLLLVTDIKLLLYGMPEIHDSYGNGCCTLQKVSALGE